MVNNRKFMYDVMKRGVALRASIILPKRSDRNGKAR